MVKLFSKNIFVLNDIKVFRFIIIFSCALLMVKQGQAGIAKSVYHLDDNYKLTKKIKLIRKAVENFDFKVKRGNLEYVTLTYKSLFFSDSLEITTPYAYIDAHDFLTAIKLDFKKNNIEIYTSSLFHAQGINQLWASLFDQEILSLRKSEEKIISKKKNYYIFNSLNLLSPNAGLLYSGYKNVILDKKTKIIMHACYLILDSLGAFLIYYSGRTFKAGRI